MIISSLGWRWNFEIYAKFSSFVGWGLDSNRFGLDSLCFSLFLLSRRVTGVLGSVVVEVSFWFCEPLVLLFLWRIGWLVWFLQRFLRGASPNNDIRRHSSIYKKSANKTSTIYCFLGNVSCQSDCFVGNIKCQMGCHDIFVLTVLTSLCNGGLFCKQTRRMLSYLNKKYMMYRLKNGCQYDVLKCS